MPIRDVILVYDAYNMEILKLEMFTQSGNTDLSGIPRDCRETFQP